MTKHFGGYNNNESYIDAIERSIAWEIRPRVNFLDKDYDISKIYIR